VTNGQPFVPVSGTTYTVTGEDANGCVNTFDVTITTSAYPTAGFSATPTSGQPPLEVTIVNQSQGDITDYAWNFGNGNFSDQDFDVNTQFYNSAGNPTIVLIVSNNGCNDTMTLVLDIQFAPFSYEIPNVFTPNNDGANDYFDLKLENVAELELYIFNRWGNLMAEIRDVNTPGWDGRMQSGDEAGEGVYFHRYRIVGLDGQEVEDHGFVHLVRE
jgi:gliding motility-associated-like protein